VLAGDSEKGTEANESPGIGTQIPGISPAQFARRSRAEQHDLYIYDDSGQMVGFVDRRHGEWRVVAHGREIGRFNSRDVALATLHAAIDTAGA